jgi:hypothetical protein
MAVAVCILLRRALSDVPSASITRNRYNFTPLSGEAQAIGCQFFAHAAASKTEIPF